VVDNTSDRAVFQTELDRVPCAVDLAEVASARYGAEPADVAASMESRTLDCHDIINLQFTRCEILIA
jgi:hypothetical protein